MKTLLSRIWKLGSLLLAIIILLTFVQNYFFTYWDHNTRRLKGFYMEDRNSLDVVLLGASEVQTGFASAQAFGEYGFTSYPLSVDSCRCMLLQAMMNEARRYQQPKLYVIEVNGFLYDDDAAMDDALLDIFTDNMPFSLNRTRMIMQLIDRDKWLDYLFPIIRYHSEWEYPKPLLKNAVEKLTMRTMYGAILKGEITSTEIMKDGKTVNVRNLEEREALIPSAEKALQEFVIYLQENGLDNVVFVRFPHLIAQEERNLRRVRRCNQIAETVQAYGYDFLNFDRDFADIGLDPAHDFYNGEHMNIYGEQKFTTYFGNLLCERYGIGPSNLRPEQQAEWELSAERMQRFYSYADQRISVGRDGAFGEREFIKIEKAG